MRIIDFHTHAFPDNVAEKAVPFLEEEAGVKAFHDGKISSLEASMKKAGIEKSVICSIATKPAQFMPILEWSLSVKSRSLVPLASAHPDDPDLADRVYTVKDKGLPGFKMHPYYQRFVLNETRMDNFYRALEETGLFLVCHTGFDIAFPDDRIADPEKIADVIKRFPRLKFVTTHMGAWKDWKEVNKLLIGKPVLLETSYSLGIIDTEAAVRMLEKHPEDYILFGSDSPWDDQSNAVKGILDLPIKNTLKEKILYKNAVMILKEKP